EPAQVLDRAIGCPRGPRSRDFLGASRLAADLAERPLKAATCVLGRLQGEQMLSDRLVEGKLPGLDPLRELDESRHRRELSVEERFPPGIPMAPGENEVRSRTFYHPL